LRLWLEQEKGLLEGTSAPILRLPHIHCSIEQRNRLEEIAQSRTSGIWRMKRAKVVLGALKGMTLERLVVDVRVPPETVVKCVEAFSKQGLKSLQKPTRKPTSREARVEKMLEMLESPSKQKGRDWRSFAVRYIGIDFSGSMIQRIRALTVTQPKATRGALARKVCRDFSFYSSAGKAKVSTLTDILKRMDMDNLILLPEVTSKKPYRKKTISKHSLLRQQEIRTWNHKDLEPLMFTPIQTPDHQHLWNHMMGLYHYLQNPRLFGPQLRYLIWGKNPDGVSERSQLNHGILLGAIGFSHAAWRLASRDAFIGWDDRQRERRLNRIIGNSRFLILPWIRCQNLASMILGRITKKVSADWKATYGIQPVLIETFVQQDRFSGTCYRAANWIEVGSTGGYSYFSSQKKIRAPKIIFLLPLCKGFRKELQKGSNL
jgi:hypothetical protein